MEDQDWRRELQNAQGACCLCLNTSKLTSMQDSFHYSMKTHTYSQIMDICLSIRISDDCMLCAECVEHLKQLWIFFSQIKATQIALRGVIVTAKNEPKEMDPLAETLNCFIKQEMVLDDGTSEYSGDLINDDFENSVSSSQSQTHMTQFTQPPQLKDESIPTNVDSSDVTDVPTSSKKRKYIYRYKAEWEQEFFFIMLKDKCTCIICLSSVAVPTKVNCKIHFRTIHEEYDKNYPLGTNLRKAKVQELLMQLNKQQSPLAGTFQRTIKCTEESSAPLECRNVAPANENITESEDARWRVINEANLSRDYDKIKPTGENKATRSSNEDELGTTNDFNKNLKRMRIVEQYSSLQYENIDNYRENTGDTYSQKMRKIKRNTGQTYCTQTGNIVPAKIFENIDCGCRKSCIKNYIEEERKAYFEVFWNLGDFNKQNILLYQSTERYAVERRRQKNGNGSPRNYSFRYWLNSTKGRISVCKKFFLDTFKISAGRLKRVLNSKNVGYDLRGRMAGSSRKIIREEKKTTFNPN